MPDINNQKEDFFEIKSVNFDISQLQVEHLSYTDLDDLAEQLQNIQTISYTPKEKVSNNLSPFEETYEKGYLYYDQKSGTWLNRIDGNVTFKKETLPNKLMSPTPKGSGFIGIGGYNYGQLPAIGKQWSNSYGFDWETRYYLKLIYQGQDANTKGVLYFSNLTEENLSDIEKIKTIHIDDLVNYSDFLGLEGMLHLTQGRTEYRRETAPAVYFDDKLYNQYYWQPLSVVVDLEDHPGELVLWEEIPYNNTQNGYNMKGFFKKEGQNWSEIQGDLYCEDKKEPSTLEPGEKHGMYTEDASSNKIPIYAQKLKSYDEIGDWIAKLNDFVYTIRIVDDEGHVHWYARTTDEWPQANKTYYIYPTNNQNLATDIKYFMRGLEQYNILTGLPQGDSNYEQSTYIEIPNYINGVEIQGIDLTFSFGTLENRRSLEEVENNALNIKNQIIIPVNKNFIIHKTNLNQNNELRLIRAYPKMMYILKENSAELKERTTEEVAELQNNILVLEHGVFSGNPVREFQQLLNSYDIIYFGRGVFTQSRINIFDISDKDFYYSNNLNYAIEDTPFLRSYRGTITEDSKTYENYKGLLGHIDNTRILIKSVSNGFLVRNDNFIFKKNNVLQLTDLRDKIEKLNLQIQTSVIEPYAFLSSVSSIKTLNLDTAANIFLESYCLNLGSNSKVETVNVSASLLSFLFEPQEINNWFTTAPNAFLNFQYPGLQKIVYTQNNIEHSLYEYFKNIPTIGSININIGYGALPTEQENGVNANASNITPEVLDFEEYINLQKISLNKVNYQSQQEILNLCHFDKVGDGFTFDGNVEGWQQPLFIEGKVQASDATGIKNIFSKSEAEKIKEFFIDRSLCFWPADKDNEFVNCLKLEKASINFKQWINFPKHFKKLDSLTTLIIYAVGNEGSIENSSMNDSVLNADKIKKVDIKPNANDLGAVDSLADRSFMNLSTIEEVYVPQSYIINDSIGKRCFDTGSNNLKLYIYVSDKLAGRDSKDYTENVFEPKIRDQLGDQIYKNNSLTNSSHGTQIFAENTQIYFYGSDDVILPCTLNDGKYNYAINKSKIYGELFGYSYKTLYGWGTYLNDDRIDSNTNNNGE